MKSGNGRCVHGIPLKTMRHRPFPTATVPKATFDFNLRGAIFFVEMCRGLEVEAFAKTAGIPVGLSRIFSNAPCASDRCRSSQEIAHFRFKGVRRRNRTAESPATGRPPTLQELNRQVGEPGALPFDQVDMGVQLLALHFFDEIAEPV